MNIVSQFLSWKPVTTDERHTDLDVLRGAALLGVLLVNLLVGFRVSLFQHILTFHTHPGWANHAVDNLMAWVFEFKAFTLFSFLFGVGVAIQAERARLRGITVSGFFARRFAVLLAFGLCHMLLIWNGDILTLYAICGFLLLPLVNRPTWLATWLFAVLGVAAIALMFVPGLDVPFPSEANLRIQAAEATRVYAQGSFSEIMVFRWREAWQFIAPLLLGSLARTFGLMLLGIAAWRAGILKKPAEHRKLLLAVLVAGLIGSVATKADSPILLAFAFSAGLLLWLNFKPGGLVRKLFAAGGQMALTNYLSQSIIFSMIFYGFGFGLFGRLGSAITACLGLVVYAGQLAASYVWLQRFRFGPAEWLWRSLTYGSRQPMRRIIEHQV
ncbi:MAG: DUF418 domain-containing protein [Acidobacteriota bacterium]